ncbi:hypothetical protein SBV1_590013 [Verrucomicrobia bacterium]|nr:hypothetical protein SBV1_590013 [Verrucomicrobiota bacterium]
MDVVGSGHGQESWLLAVLSTRHFKTRGRPRLRCLEQLQDFFVGGLRELVVVGADRLEFRVHVQHLHVVGDATQALGGAERGYRGSDDDPVGALFSHRQNGRFRSGAGGQAVVHQEHVFALERGKAGAMELALIAFEPPLLFVNHLVQFEANQRAASQDPVIEHNDVRFGEGADGEFAVQRVPDFADDENVQRDLQSAGDFGCDDDAAPGQTQDHVSPDFVVVQKKSQAAACLLARGESHLN